MKVLMTADTVGGVWNYAVQLCKSLAAHDTDVLLATMGRNVSAPQREELSEIPRLVHFESDYKLEWMQDPWEDVKRAGEWLLAIEQHFKPDVIHLNGYAHANLNWHAPSVVVAHSCVYSWWLAVRGSLPPDSDWALYRKNVVGGLMAAHCVIAPTQAMRSSIQTLYGIEKDISVVENGRDGTFFRPARRKEHFIVSAGRVWDDAKNISQLERIGEQLKRPVYIAGEAAHPDGLTRSVQNNSCTRLGHLNQKTFAELLGRAEIFCLPARYEPFGLAVLEAALSGCVLVLGDIPSLRELWNGAAVFVQPGNDSRLVSALRHLTGDPDRISAFSSLAKKRASLFTPESMAAKYMQHYKRLISTRPTKQEVSACEL